MIKIDTCNVYLFVSPFEIRHFTLFDIVNSCFTFRSDFFIVQRNIEKKQKMLVDSMRKFTICTGNTMRSVLGLSLCQKVHFPNASRHEATPYFPFTGPVLYDLHMKNEDAPNGYEMTFDAEVGIVEIFVKFYKKKKLYFLSN